MKTHQQCLSDEILTTLLEGQLSAVDEEMAQQHLQSCDDCCVRMREHVGDAEWWAEADELLADFGELFEPGDQPSKRETGSDRQPTASVIAHLKQWMGPTDDPSKLGRIGSFEVIGIVGVGGAGIVLKAFDARLNRFVAIKTLLPALAHSVLARRRFERESRAVAAITHQHVVPIYAVDSYNDHPYIAMQYVAGQSLQRRLDEQGPLQPIEAVRIAAQIARALAAAHAQGVVHRDIKPANILLEESVDRVMVTDFGLARVIDEASTHSGAVTGTPQYMSPEQCHGHPADERSDLFSLGSVLYAMCVGRAPFRADTLMGMLRKVCESPLRDAREINPDVPQWLQAFIERLHQKNPEDRFRSASQVADLLESELAHMQNPATVVPPPRTWAPKRSAISTPSIPMRKIVMSLASTAFAAFLLYSAIQAPTEPISSSELTIAPVSLDESGKPHPSTDGVPLFELRESQVFAIEPGGKLELVVDSGHIETKAGENPHVEVERVHRIAAENEDQAELLAAHHTMSASADEGTLTIHAEMDPAFKKSDQRKSFKQINFIVTVPKSMNLDFKTAGGHITIADLSGEIKASTSGGHIKLSHVEGAVEAHTSGGHITVGDAGGNVEAISSGGHITLGNVTGSVNALTSGGHINVKEVRGTIVGKTSGGNVKVTLSQQPTADCALETSGGNVQVHLAKDLKLSIEAKVGGGRIHAPFFETKKGKESRSLVHELNGGGPKLSVKSGGGNARIEFLGGKDK